MTNSFNTRATLTVGDRTYSLHRLRALEEQGFNLQRLPYSLRILLENLLRHEDGAVVRPEDVRALCAWDATAAPSYEIAYMPARVLMQDLTGVPAVVDLAAMRDAIATLGGNPNRINPLIPAELVIDHSVQVDAFGNDTAYTVNTELEYERNSERYRFLRWGQRSLANFAVVPPETGICHQVNIEYLARVVFPGAEYDENASEPPMAYPDTVVGTDSHTTMVNGIGVLGWGVGGIEAEAAMLGQPVSMLIPQVVGFKLIGALPEGATATDLVLTVTEMLRAHGVVGKFVEFFGPGLASLPLADRATIANMAPEYGATCGIFPVDEETLRYLRFTGRSNALVDLVESYMREQGLFHTAETPEAEYSSTLGLDLSTVVPSIAGPKRPQDRIALSEAKSSFDALLEHALPKRDAALDPTAQGQLESFPTSDPPSAVQPGSEHEHTHTAVPVVREDGASYEIDHGAVVIAAITSCTNTSNPSVMVAAGLLAKKAVERGLTRRPWVKTSLAPGSKVVTDYLKRAGLDTALDQLGFQTVGYGCTTCIGNSGPLPEEISIAIARGNLIVSSVLSGNRNFEGRVHPEVRANYLMSPPLVVAYAIAGRMTVDLFNEPIGHAPDGTAVYLRDIWPTQAEVAGTIESALQSDMYRKSYDSVFTGTEQWRALEALESEIFAWEPESTYVRNPPYFEGMTLAPPTVIHDITGARVLAMLGDSVTTDHISPAGSIKRDSPAARYLTAHGVQPADFNSYGARRGNHEVMMRGTFANIRLRNLLAPGTEGGVTTYLPTGEITSIYDASMLYQQAGTPLVVIGGKEYGTGSSRDWAAKGTRLLGARAVLVESFERIHRSNLVGMGVLPLEFLPGEGAAILGLTGHETYDIVGLASLFDHGFPAQRTVTIRATAENGTVKEFRARVRIDTPQELAYYRHGGILHYVLRQLAAGTPQPAEVTA